MPHKHKRKRVAEGDDYDLPPAQKALPLPVSQPGRNATKPTQPSKRQKSRKANEASKDVPRKFRRLMAFSKGKKVRSGLDDGLDEKAKTEPQEPVSQLLRIRPGEDARSFSTRVDAALPISGLATKTKTKDGKDSLGLQVRRTRKERKMHKLYDQWRAEEQKIQENREEVRELAEERELENEELGMQPENVIGRLSQSSKGKKGKKKHGKTDDEDPWLELTRKRGETKFGLHDVAQAPPELPRKGRPHLHIGGAAVDVDGVPKASGSLRRREELQEARNDVIDAYRKIREHEQAKLNARNGS